MSCEHIAVEIVQIPLILIEILCKMWQKPFKKCENTLVEKNSKLIFQTFSCLIFSKKHEVLWFYIKSEEKLCISLEK
jgi:hypothetical protein